MVFTADGKMTREPIGSGGAKGEGTWKLTGDGFCSTWKGSKANCYQVVAAGENRWSVMKGKSVGRDLDEVSIRKQASGLTR